MRKSFGHARLHALPASDVWHARAALTLYAVEPRSTVTVRLNAAGLRPGDMAGLALFSRPFAWLGVERGLDGFTLILFGERSGQARRVPLGGRPVWLRAECDFVRNTVGFSHSADGTAYVGIGEPHPMGDDPAAARDLRCSLFCCRTTLPAEVGYADFDSFVMTTEWPGHRGVRRRGPGGLAVSPGFRRRPGLSSPAGRARDR